MTKLTVLQLVLLALSTYRATILVTRDTMPFGWLRTRIDRSFTGDLVELIHCVWCLSIWIGAGFACLEFYEWRWWQWPAFVLSASGVAGFLGERS